MSRDTLVWAVAVFAVLANAAVGVLNTDRTVARDRGTKQRVTTRSEISETLLLVRDAEAGHRGYVLTGEASHLQPLRDAERDLPAHFGALRLALDGSPDRLARLDAVESSVAARFAEMRRTLAVRDAAGRDAAAAEIALGRGKALTDEIRAGVAVMLREQDRLLEADQAESRGYRETALLTIVVGALLTVAVIAVSATVVRGEVARRVSSFDALGKAKEDAESALNQLDAFVRNAPCGIAYYNADLRYILANDAFARLNRVPPEALIGKSIDEAPPQFPLALREEYLEVSRRMAPSAGRRLAIGDETWEISVFPVRATKTERVGLGVIGIDVTAAAEAEARVVESEARFRTMAEAMPQIVWMTRPDGYHEYYNARWYEFTGLTPAQSIGWGWSGPLHPDDLERSKARWQLSVEDAVPYEIEYRFRGADGKYRWFLARANPIRNERGTVGRWLGTCTDIDDSRRSAERLEDVVEARTLALQRSNEELEKFAYIASHDLQEPLRKIQAFGDRLNTRFKAGLGEQGQDYIARMLDSAGRMRRLIDDLLMFSRVATKLAPLGMVNLNSVVRDVLSDLEVRVGQTEARVEVGPLPTLPADPAQMRQLFQNLVSNALKFRRPDVPPVVTIWAEPSPDLPGGCRVRVADNGIGFEPQYTDRIFQLSQRLHGRQQYEGTGLGLAICKKIAERHGGAITAEGCPGEGSTFIIDLPLTAEPESRNVPPSLAGHDSRRR